jgi:hypothetical protein
LNASFRRLTPYTPAALVAALAAAVLALHTGAAWRYFAPSWDDVLLCLAPWGPYLAETWLPHLGRIAVAALFFASLPGLGGTSSLFRSTAAAPMNLFADAGVALVAWSTLGILLAAAGLCTPEILRPVSVVLVLAGLIAGFPRLRSLASSLFRAVEWRRGEAAETRGLLAVCAGFGLLYLLTTAVPETFYDALVYHLAVPSAYLREGRWVDLPDVHLSRIPGLWQTLALWGLAWGDDRLCKLLSLGIGLLSAGAVGAWTARRWNARAGAWAAALLLSSPLVGVNLWSCANDLLSGFLLFLAFAAWNDARDGDSLSARGAALAGLFFGAAVAAKYNAAFGALYFLWDFFEARRRARRVSPWAAWAGGAAFAACAAAVLLPWWARSALWTGNPFFPHAVAALGGDSPENIALLRTWHEDMTGGGILARLLSFPRESLTGVTEGRFGFIGPAPLMLLLAVLFVREDGATRRLAGWTAAGYVLFAAVSGRLRYFLPLLGPVFALAAGCLEDHRATARAAWDDLRSRGRRLPLGDPGAWLAAFAAAAVLLNGLWLALVFQRFNQGWDVVWGRVRAEDYLRAEHIGVYGHPSQGAWDHLRDAGARGRVFLVGEARTYRCPLPASASGAFNVPAFARRLDADPEPVAFLRRLRDDGFTHVLLNAPELRRLTPEPYVAGPYMRGLGRALDTLPPPVYRDRWAVLFRLDPPEPRP